MQNVFDCLVVVTSMAAKSIYIVSSRAYLYPDRFTLISSVQLVNRYEMKTLI